MQQENDQNKEQYVFVKIMYNIAFDYRYWVSSDKSAVVVY